MSCDLDQFGLAEPSPWVGWVVSFAVGRRTGLHTGQNQQSRGAPARARLGAGMEVGGQGATGY